MKEFLETYIYTLKDGLSVFLSEIAILILIIVWIILFPKLKIISLPFLFIVMLLIALTIVFFRDPKRITDYKRNIIYSPADGVVSSLDVVEEKEYLNAKCYRIKIFMNIFNVHRNRIPMSGTVEMVKYKKGKMEAAFKEVEESNEQSIIIEQTKYGKICFKQIAGLVARRIVFHLKSGDKVSAGKVFGMIKFGSAVIIYVPYKRSKVLVSHGLKVKAGLSELIQFN